MWLTPLVKHLSYNVYGTKYYHMSKYSKPKKNVFMVLFSCDTKSHYLINNVFTIICQKLWNMCTQVGLIWYFIKKNYINCVGL